MPDYTPDQSWTSRSTARAENRPRILFSDHMVVFASNGVRNSIMPPRMWSDGFDTLMGHIYAAGPEDLAPENHETFKAKLSEKIEEAKALPFSKREQNNIRESFYEDVVERVVQKHPRLVIDYLNKFDAHTRTQYSSPAALKKVAKEEAVGTFDGYHLRELTINALDGNKNACKQLRILMHSRQLHDEFFDIEMEVAKQNIRHLLNAVPISDQKKDRIVAQSVVIRPNEKGDKRIFLDMRPMQQIHRELLEKNYADLDQVINDARARLVETAALSGIEEPFAHTLDESVTIDRIHEIAHQDRRAKPVILAGYNDSNLTIIIEREPNAEFIGRSYPGQNMIQAVFSSIPGENFDRTLTEELLHQGTDKIYKNFSLPYVNDDDNRKMLLEEAIHHDILDKEHLHQLTLSAALHYHVSNQVNMHQEIPVKVLTYMDDVAKHNMWSPLPRGVNAYCALETFVHEVMIKDATAYNMGKPLPSINMDFERTPEPFERRVSGSGKAPSQGLW